MAVVRASWRLCFVGVLHIFFYCISAGAALMGHLGAQKQSERVLFFSLAARETAATVALFCLSKMRKENTNQDRPTQRPLSLAFFVNRKQGRTKGKKKSLVYLPIFKAAYQE